MANVLKYKPDKIILLYNSLDSSPTAAVSGKKINGFMDVDSADGLQ